MSNLCQLATVKRRLAMPQTDTKDDVILDNAIASVSVRLAKFCSREFARAAAATYEFSADETELRVDRYPIESITSFALKAGETTGWETQDVGDDFAIIRRSCVISLSFPLGTWRQQARVTYAGGYVLPGSTPSGSQQALPDAIEQAAVEQVVFWYQNRTRLGLTSTSGEGGSVSVFADLDLIPAVRNAIEPYRRINS